MDDTNDKTSFYIYESMGSQYNPSQPNNNNGTIITIWGIQGYNNKNKGATLTTTKIGTTLVI